MEHYIATAVCVSAFTRRIMMIGLDFYRPTPVGRICPFVVRASP